MAPLAVAQTWTRVAGTQLSDIAAGRDGSVYGLSRVTPTAAGLPIVRWNASTQSWTPVPGLATRLAVASNGELWAVNGQGQIFRTTNAGTNWASVTGSASDISARNMVWAIGPNSTPYRFNPATSAWDTAPGPAVRVAAGNEAGVAYMLDANGAVWHRNSGAATNLMATPWQRIEGGVLSDLTVDVNGRLWGVSRTAEPSAPGNFKLVAYTPQGGWVNLGGAATRISASQTDVWVVTAAGDVFTTPTLNTSGLTGGVTLIQSATGPALTVSGTPLVPTAPPAPPVIQISGMSDQFERAANEAMKGGTTLCQGASCVDPQIKPYYVGPYRLDMNCGTAGSGYNNGNLNYSALWGGTCWKCPENDGKGNPWNWDVSKVNSPDACWRVPFESFGPATWVKHGFAHECDSSKGEFYDIYKADGGLGHSCWKCADPARPRRSQFLVAGPTACATPVRESQDATLWKYNGCPSPVAANMNLPGRMQPGRPFLNIGRGWSEGVLSGGCYACPATDAEGNMVATGDYNCNLEFKWKPTPMPAPGLTGFERLAGGQGTITALLNERKVFTDHTAITALLYTEAYAQGLKDTAALEYVKAEWPKLAAAPYQHKAMRSAVFLMLLNIAQKNAAARTQVEAKAYQAFTTYLTLRRQWMAHQALNMYDGWYAAAHARRAASADSRNPLTTAFFYGIVPINFTNTFAAVMAPTATAAGVMGSIGAAQAMSAAVQTRVLFDTLGVGREVATRASTLFGVMNGNLTNLGTVASAVSGATVITVVASILGSIAIDQFMAIQTARPNLQAAVGAAASPVDLAALAATPVGRDQLQLSWGLAMDTTEQENAAVIASLTTLQRLAAAANYALK